LVPPSSLRRRFSPRNRWSRLRGLIWSIGRSLSGLSRKRRRIQGIHSGSSAFGRTEIDRTRGT
jgi:hypothetical protein